MEIKSEKHASERVQNEVQLVDEEQSECAGKCMELSDRLGDAYVNLLPTKKLIICMMTLSIGLFISFTDQTAIMVALPTISKELHAETSINWAGTAALLANCVSQVIIGRMADIFGRKSVLMCSLIILAIAQIAVGVSKNGIELYVFRAISGIGNGGTQAMTMTIVSDIVSLRKRGKYLGILASFIGIANLTGPLVLGALTKYASWRDFYYMMPGIAVLACASTYFVVDSSAKNVNEVLSRRDKFRRIDYLGFFFSTATLVFLLVPISGGGIHYAWNSPLVISFFIIGGLSLITFVIIEWLIPELPMIPISLFKNLLLNLILLSNFFYGIGYYGFTYYVTFFFQIVRGYDTIVASALLIPCVLTQALTSALSGQLISYTGHYKYVILVGYTSWLLGCCLLLLWSRTLNLGVIVVTMIIMGFGIGNTFQPTMVAAQAQAKKSQRAVVIGTRNVIRSFGGAIGIAIGSLIVSNSLVREISKALRFPDNYANIPKIYLMGLKGLIYTKVNTEGLTQSQVNVIRDMYMTCIKNFFYLPIPLIALCLISTLFIKDRGLQCIDEEPEPQDK